MNREQKRLCDAVDWFAQKMKDKLIEKQIHGWHGWRDAEFVASGDCKQRCLEHAVGVQRYRDAEVDTANFCMFMAHFEHFDGVQTEGKG